MQSHMAGYGVKDDYETYEEADDDSMMVSFCIRSAGKSGANVLLVVGQVGKIIN